MCYSNVSVLEWPLVLGRYSMAFLFYWDVSSINLRIGVSNSMAAYSLIVSLLVGVWSKSG